MRRVLFVLMVVLLSVSLCACGVTITPNTETESSAAEEVSGEALVLETPNTVADYADFTLFKISTTKKITASIGGGSSYENKIDGKTYVDIVLDWKNTSAEPIGCDEVVVAYATNASGTVYRDCLYAIETDNATDISQFDNIAPLSTVRLHCAISVPTNETALTLTLEAKGKKYTYEYSLGGVESSAKALKVGDVIDEPDYASFTFKGIQYTDDLLPSNTSGAYSHYEVDNASNTYLVVKFDITNYMSSEKDCEVFAGIKAQYLNKYTYTGFVVVEDDDGKGFSSYEDIAPLSTRHFYYLIEVPKTVAENAVSLTISFNGKEYTYTAN